MEGDPARRIANQPHTLQAVVHKPLLASVQRLPAGRRHRGQHGRSERAWTRSDASTFLRAEHVPVPSGNPPGPIYARTAHLTSGNPLFRVARGSSGETPRPPK